MAVRGSLLLAAGIVVLAAVSPPLAEGGAAAAHSCGARGGRTLTSGRSIRIYVLSKTVHEFDHDAQVPLVFGCVKPAGHPRLLGSTSSSFAVTERIGLMHPETLVSAAPWVAYPLLETGGGYSSLMVITTNLRTNARGDCSAGGAVAREPVPSVSDIALGRAGSVVWAGESNFDTRYAMVPMVVSCAYWSGERVLESGAGIDLHSLSLHGSILTWMNEGATRSAVLE